MHRKTIKQILAFVMFAVMIVTTFSACSSKEKKEPENKPAATFTAQWVSEPIIDAQAIDPIVRADFNENTNHYDISFADCFRIMRNSKYGLIDLNGKIVVEPKYDKLFAIRGSEDFLGIKTSENGEKTQTYIHNKTFDTEPAYKEYNYEKYEYYWNTDTVKAMFVEVSGGAEKEKDFAPSLPEILKGVTHSGNKFTPDGTYGLYCNSSNITGMRYSGAGCFSDGKAAFCSNGKWGYLDSTGRTVVPFEYDAVWGYSAMGGEDTPYESFDGYVTLCKDKKFGVMKDDGTIVADFIYDGATPVVDGKAFAKVEGKWGIISVDGSNEHIDVTTTTTTTKKTEISSSTTEKQDEEDIQDETTKTEAESTTEKTTEETTSSEYEGDVYGYAKYPSGTYRTYNNISLRSTPGGDTIITTVDGIGTGVSFYVDKVDGEYGHIIFGNYEGWVNLDYAEKE